MFLAAAVQITSTSDEASSLESVEALARRAASYGASFIATPENTNFLGPHAEKVRRAETLEGPTVARFAALARELGAHFLLGSFNEKSAEETRSYNTSVLFGPDGSILGIYRKIHLFDVEVSDTTCFRESETVVPGSDVVVARTALGSVGLSICYDLRFPELYRRLVDQGAQILTIPSAFTLTTGKDHWHALVRSRAIESQCYVIASGQHGRHDDEGLRESYGHSLIVDPWGQEIAMAPDGPGLALAEIDVERVTEVRRRIPLSSHRRLR